MPKTVTIIVVGAAKSARIFLEPLTTLPTTLHIDLLWFLAITCGFKRSKSVILSLVLSLRCISVFRWCLAHTPTGSRESRRCLRQRDPSARSFKAWSLDRGLGDGTKINGRKKLTLLSPALASAAPCATPRRLPDSAWHGESRTNWLAESSFQDVHRLFHAGNSDVVWSPVKPCVAADFELQNNG